MTGPRQNDIHKSVAEQDRVISANYLFFEEKLPLYKIQKRLGISESTLDRILFLTMDQWREFRDGLGK